MSYRAYHHYSENYTEDGVENTMTSVVVRELDDFEAEVLLSGHSLDTLTPNMLKSPPFYEISDEDLDSVASHDSSQEEEEEEEEEEDDWFPSLLKESMIEFLEDDTRMLDGHETLLDSEEDAEIVEREEKQPRTSREQVRVVPIEIICLDY